MIAPSQAAIITLQFTELSTQFEKDTIEVFQCTDIACSKPLHLAVLSGWDSTTQSVTSTTGFMKVVFTSDASINYDGFRASWTTVSLNN